MGFSPLCRKWFYYFGAFHYGRWMDQATKRRYFSVNVLASVLPTIIGTLHWLEVLALRLPQDGRFGWLL